MNKIKKTLLILVGIILTVLLLIIVFVSPIAKYLIEKYDEKFTGRQITMDWIYVNPFTGYVHIEHLNIYEYKSDTVFFSVEGVNGDFDMIKLLSKNYEITELILDHPRGIVIKNKKVFNFDDLITTFSPKDTTDTTSAPVHFNILNIKIHEGEFHYWQKSIPVKYFIKNVMIESPGKRWDSDTIAVKFSFLSGIGAGDMKGNFTIHFKSKDYRLAVLVHQFDLKVIEEYLDDITNYGHFEATLNADIKAKGNFTDGENITASGKIAVSDFHFGKSKKDDYASFDKLVLTIDELSPKNHKYFFDSISLSHPCVKYEKYDYLDNIQTIFGKKGSNVMAASIDHERFNLVIEIAKYVKVLAQNFFQSSYKINRVSIEKANVTFNDYSINEKFSVQLNPLYIHSDSIDKENNWVTIFLQSGIKPYGNAKVSLSINPKDSSDFDLRYHLQRIPASMFNPYVITYTSFPFDRGTIELNGTWKVRNGAIQSENHLVIIDPRVTQRLRNKNIKWLPVPLIMSFIREKGNVIDYEIPITGHLKNPKFHFHDVVSDLLKNIFVKPATTAYRTEVQNIETEIEKSLTIKWRMQNSTLLPSQKKFIRKMAAFLVKNPDASIDVYPQDYTLKEKEYILLFEAKKKYFMVANNKKVQSFTESDSFQVVNMSIKSTLFIHYLNNQVKDSMLFTVQDKCARLIDSSVVNMKFRKLNREREEAFIYYFKEKEVHERIKITRIENVVPYNGFSFYKIKYKDEFPDFLLKAYQEMKDLNESPPRSHFRNERKKTRNIL